MEEWDRNEWQGRTKKQVEENYKVMRLTYILFFITLAIVLIF